MAVPAMTTMVTTEMIVWEATLNFQRYQQRKERLRHYKYPGLCPLEVAAVMVQAVTWLDALAV